MQESLDSVAEMRDGVAETGPGPALPLRRDVILIVLFFLFVTIGIRSVLIPMLLPIIRQYLEPEKIRSFSSSSGAAAWFLNLVDSRAALLTSVFLYFPVVRRELPGVWREKRGEILTGLVNLHILVLAIALAVAAQFWREISPLYVGSVVLGYIVSTAFWCVIGFHLCEGRYLVPLGGILAWFLLLNCFQIAIYVLPVAAWGGIIVLAPLLGLTWEVWTLIRAGGGFDLFPTGLWPAMRRCARVFLLSAVTFWLLGDVYWFLAGGPEHFYALSELGSRYGLALELPLAYLVPLFLLGWPAGEMERRSRKLTLVLLGVVVLATIVCVPISYLKTYGLRWYLISLLGGPFGLFSLLLFPFWTVFVPISIFRWWARGVFLRPVLVAASGICFAGSLYLLFEPELRTLGIAYILGRLFVIPLAVPLLFLRIPPQNLGLQTRAPGGNNSEESTPEMRRP